MNSRFSYMRNISFSGLKDHIGLPPSESAIIFFCIRQLTISHSEGQGCCFSEGRTRAERDWHYSIMVRWSERKKTACSPPFLLNPLSS